MLYFPFYELIFSNPLPEPFPTVLKGTKDDWGTNAVVKGLNSEISQTGV